MKRSISFVCICLVVFAASCCSKKSTCPATTFNQIELLNFNSNDLSDSVSLLVYEAGTNFLSIMDSFALSVQATDDPNRFISNVSTLNIKNDYAVKVGKIGESYRISNFSVKKVECGKCFLRNNNKYGYKLYSYTVNTKPLDFEGLIRISR